MSRPTKYPRELRERAVRMVLEHRDEYDSEWEAMRSIAGKLGIGTTETLRKWVRQAEVDQGLKRGPTTEELAEIRQLRKEVADQQRTIDILKAAATCFAREADPRQAPRPLAGRGDVHRDRTARAQLLRREGPAAVGAVGQRCGPSHPYPSGVGEQLPLLRRAAGPQAAAPRGLQDRQVHRGPADGRHVHPRRAAGR